MGETDSTQPVERRNPTAQYLSDAMGTPRLSTLLLATLGTISLLLAVVSIYGVIGSP